MFGLLFQSREKNGRYSTDATVKDCIIVDICVEEDGR